VTQRSVDIGNGSRRCSGLCACLGEKAGDGLGGGLARDQTPGINCDAVCKNLIVEMPPVTWPSTARVACSTIPKDASLPFCTISALPFSEMGNFRHTLPWPSRTCYALHQPMLI
jgi:hypothetical protein